MGCTVRSLTENQLVKIKNMLVKVVSSNKDLVILSLNACIIYILFDGIISCCTY